MLVFKERLVGAHHLGVFLQALLNAGAQADQALDTFGRQEGVAANLFGFLADAVNATGTLDEANDGPGQVEVDHHAAVLQVLSLGQNVGANQDANFVCLCDTLVVGMRRELAGQRIGIGRGARGHRQIHDAAAAQLAAQIARGVGELGEDQDLVFGVSLRRQLAQLRQLAVTRGIPRAVRGQHLAQRLGVGGQMLGQQRLEQLGPDPFEALLVVGGVLPINRLRTGQSVGLHVNFIDHLHHAVEQVFLVALDALRVFVDAVGVQQASVEHAHGQVEPVLDGVEVDAVAKNVTVDRLQEREPR